MTEPLPPRQSPDQPDHYRADGPGPGEPAYGQPGYWGPPAADHQPSPAPAPHGDEPYGRHAYGQDAYGQDAYGREAGGTPAYGGDAGGRPAYAAPAGAATATRPRGRRAAAGVAGLTLAAGLVGGVTGGWLADRGGTSGTTSSLSSTSSGSGKPVSLQPGSVASIAAKVLPSVVSIEETGSSGSGEGSGVIIGSGGTVLTNNHVVAGAVGGGSLSVQLQDGSNHPAHIVGRDPSSDLAVIQIEGVSDLPTVTLGRSSALRVGDQVVAIGSPLGLSGTVTTGIVSSLNRPVRTGDETSTDPTTTVIDAIQTDAAINPGNSGGPLVDGNGDVVGINSAIASLGSTGGGQSGNIGVGFAIPIDQARPIADQLLKTGHAQHAFLGVSVASADATSSVSGATLATVDPNGPAGKAGLRQGDVVTAIGARHVDSADALVAAVRSAGVGTTVTVHFLRDGDARTVTAKLGSRQG